MQTASQQNPALQDHPPPYLASPRQTATQRTASPHRPVCPMRGHVAVHEDPSRGDGVPGVCNSLVHVAHIPRRVRRRETETEHSPWALAGLLRQFGSIRALEGLDVGFEGAALDALTDSGEEPIHDVVVVELQ